MARLAERKQAGAFYVNLLNDSSVHGVRSAITAAEAPLRADRRDHGDDDGKP